MAVNENNEKTAEFYDIDKNFTLIVTWFAGIILLAMVGMIIKEMIARNLGAAGGFTSEATEIMVMWIFLVPMAFAQLDGGMVRVTFIVDKFSSKTRAKLKIISTFMAFLFSLCLGWANYSFFVKAVSGSYYPETGFPAIIQRGMPPVAALLLAVAALLSLIREISMLRNGDLQFIEEGAEN